jgi:hypothetical protein
MFKKPTLERHPLPRYAGEGGRRDGKTHQCVKKVTFFGAFVCYSLSGAIIIGNKFAGGKAYEKIIDVVFYTGERRACFGVCSQ